jgi:cysteine sulfinate desulfinase/cysteine desulfurase-like protein
MWNWVSDPRNLRMAWRRVENNRGARSAGVDIGALFVRRGVSLEPLIHGAGHEGGRRAGTESALLTVGLGKACELALNLTPMDRVSTLRDHFWQALREQFGNRVALNGHPTYRLPNTLNVSFVGRIGAEILERLRDAHGRLPEGDVNSQLVAYCYR